MEICEFWIEIEYEYRYLLYRYLLAEYRYLLAEIGKFPEHLYVLAPKAHIKNSDWKSVWDLNSFHYISRNCS
jgi:hypothetical protein